MTEPLTPDQALAVLLAVVPSPRVQNLPPERCVGLVAADDVFAAADLPPFARAMMDGFAVRSGDAGTTVAVLDEIAAGDGAVRAVLAAGHAHPIMTGAPVPPGADAVVAWEICTRTGNTVPLPENIKSGANIVARGAECAAGRPWLRRGQVVTPMTVAAAIATGNTELSVCVSPTVAVLTTGSELSDRFGHGLIRDSNGPMLVATITKRVQEEACRAAAKRRAGVLPSRNGRVALCGVPIRLPRPPAMMAPAMCMCPESDGKR